VVVIGDAEYPVDTSKPPVYFFPTYLAARLPPAWCDAQDQVSELERHPLADWLKQFKAFLATFDARGHDGEYRDILTAKVRALLVLAYDMYSLDQNPGLQDSLIYRLIDKRAFQGALHEVYVAATVMRAGFDIEYENENDSARKHPEFIATHRRSGVRIAVEAKSIHRAGVLAYATGNPPPTMETASAHKIAAQICGQVQRALPKAIGFPLYVFVDLNLPPQIAEKFAPSVLDEFKVILPQLDPGLDDNGVFIGKVMNLLVVTNQPMHLGEERHKGGDTLMMFVDPPEGDCQFPEGSRHIDDVKAAIKKHGTVLDD